MRLRFLGAAACALALALQPASAQNVGGSGLNVPAASSGSSGSSSLTVGTTPTSGAAAGQVMYDSGSVLEESAYLDFAAGILIIGASGTLGGVRLGNATSGTVTIEPATGALGTVTASLPANTGTIAELNLTQTWSGNQNFAAGTASAPLLTLGNSTTGLYSVSTTGFGISINGTSRADYNISLANVWDFSGGLTAAGTITSGGNIVTTSGFVETLQLIVAGTKPTLTTGSCSGSSAVGGNSVGSFTAALCSAGTYILTGLYSAPNGYQCDAQDETTPGDTLKQTAHTTTSATFTATTAANDVVVFKCLAF